MYTFLKRGTTLETLSQASQKYVENICNSSGKFLVDDLKIVEGV